MVEKVRKLASEEGAEVVLVSAQVGVVLCVCVWCDVCMCGVCVVCGGVCSPVFLAYLYGSAPDPLTVSCRLRVSTYCLLLEEVNSKP
jgi:hypothetical protein